MNKKLLYGILVILIIIVFTVVWKNSQKDKTGGEVENTNTPQTEVKDQTVKKESAASISEDINKINVDSGIDSDLNAIDTDLKTL